MYDRILLTTDGSDAAAFAAPHAIDLARGYDAELHVLSVADLRPWHKGAEQALVADEIHEAAEKAAAELADRARDEGIDVETAVLRGTPHGEIVEYARDQDVDLIVMATHGRTGWRHALLGSVAERVVRHADQPVLTVRPDAID